jgi:hypothetical protein
MANKNITVQSVLGMESLQSIFYCPCQKKLIEHFCELHIIMQNIQVNGDEGSWSYIWGNEQFSSPKAYKHMMGANAVHLAFSWIWRFDGQMKQKVIF